MRHHEQGLKGRDDVHIVCGRGRNSRGLGLHLMYFLMMMLEPAACIIP